MRIEVCHPEISGAIRVEVLQEVLQKVWLLQGILTLDRRTQSIIGYLMKKNLENLILSDTKNHRANFSKARESQLI